VNWTVFRPVLRKLLFVVILVLMAVLTRSLRAAPTDNQERAVSALQQAVKSDPNNPELWLHLGFAYRKVNDVDQAQSAFEKARALDPRNDDALYMLGLIYEKKHQTKEALKAWQDYLAASTNTAKRNDAEKHIHQLSQ
jgi:cytochrome c-type biogenesis protein CcmH/NrfG